MSLVGPEGQRVPSSGRGGTGHILSHCPWHWRCVLRPTQLIAPPAMDRERLEQHRCCGSRARPAATFHCWQLLWIRSAAAEGLWWMDTPIPLHPLPVHILLHSHPTALLPGVPHPAASSSRCTPIPLHPVPGVPLPQCIPLLEHRLPGASCPGASLPEQSPCRAPSQGIYWEWEVQMSWSWQVPPPGL